MPSTRLRSIVATADPAGGYIDLRWVYADPGRPTSPDEATARLRILRRERTYPATPTDGVIIADNTAGDDPRLLMSNGGASCHVRDGGLKGETTYYYSLFSLDENGFASDPFGRTFALSSSPFGRSAVFVAAGDLPQV
jgi:hypothetical protein